MIIYNIYQRTGIEAIAGAEENFCFLCYGVSIGECVDGSVEGDAMLNGFWVVQLLLSFYKIADQIAYGDVGVAEGQVCVCQIIHLCKGTAFMGM